MSNEKYLVGHDFIGKICIRCGNENQEPSVVYVVGINSFDMLICHALNTGTVFLSDPERSDILIDFDFDVFVRLKTEWKLKNAKRSVQSLQNDLDKILKDSEG